MAITKIPGRATDFVVTTDPNTGVALVGDCWYNSTDKEFKFKIGEAVQTGAGWSVGGSTIQVYKSGDGPGGGFGTLLAACVFGGRQAYQFVSDGGSIYSDEYDGTAFTAAGNLPYKIWENVGSLGSQTAGLHVGGSGPHDTESMCTEYDGTTWTATATLSPAGNGIMPSFSGGVQTAGYVAGGNTGTGVGNNFSHTALTFEYDGSTWTTGNALVNGQSSHGGSQTGSTGTQTAGLAVAGTYGAHGSTTLRNSSEEYDGTTWTSGGSLATARGSSWNTGIQTNAYASGGSWVAGVTTTEGYDGTTWSQVSSAWFATPLAQRHYYRSAGAGYTGTGAYAGTGFGIIPHGLGNIESVGYCEEWADVGTPYTADVIHKTGAVFTVYNSGS